MSDFFFLAVSLLLILLNIGRRAGKPKMVAEEVVQSRESIRRAICENWTFGDVAKLSNQRAGTDQVVDLFADLVARGRDQSYSRDADLFTADLNRLIYLKRLIFLHEIVLD
jgi:hypothetical protein